MHCGKARRSNPFFCRSSVSDMERRSSAVKTPLRRVLQRRSRSYRASWHSCAAATSYNPGQLTALRVPTSRTTPKSRRITVDPEQLSLLVKREWTLSYVTPLFRFRHTQLKAYARQLAAFLLAERQRGMGVEVGPGAGPGAESSFKVSFSVVAGLAETEQDAETVFIQIHSKPQFAGKDDAPRLAWSGWLSCVSGDPVYLSSLPADFLSLPLFLSSGAESLTQLVTSWFRRTFDCCFGPLTLDPTTLRWLAALWTSCHGDDAATNIQYLKLAWALPSAPRLDVTCSVQPQSAWELWSSVWRGEGGAGEEGEGEGHDGSSVDLQEVTRFMQGLEAHLYRHFRVDLSSGELTQVSTALGSARHSGRVKISSSSYMTTVLTLLTECALLKMPL